MIKPYWDFNIKEANTNMKTNKPKHDKHLNFYSKKHDYTKFYRNYF